MLKMFDYMECNKNFYFMALFDSKNNKIEKYVFIEKYFHIYEDQFHGKHCQQCHEK